MLIRSRREEGQVYPALLLAVIGGFAIAVSFIPLQNLFDQTGRADTAADSAALAAAKSHRELWENIPMLPFTPSTRMGVWLEKLRSSGLGARAEAVKLAEANGANVIGFRADPYRFDFAKKRAVYEVITQQEDTVKGGDASVKSKSRAMAAAEVTNGYLLCGTNAIPGAIVEGMCYTAETWAIACAEVPNNPNLGKLCIAPFPELEWKIRLVKE